MHPRATLAAIAAGSAMTLLAACGTANIASNDSSAKPKVELAHSIHALAKSKAVTATLSLDTTAANILHIASLGGGPVGLTQAQAQAIAGAHVSVEVLAPKGETVGQAGKAPTKESMALAVGTGSSTYLSVRSVGGSIYAQVNIKGFLALIGKSGEYTALQARVASLPTFVKSLVAGKWVSISFVTIKAIEAFAKGQLHGKIPSAGKSLKLDQQLIAAVVGDLAVTRPSTGKTDHLVITGNVRRLARSAFGVIAKAIPMFAGIGRGAVRSVPSVPIVFNAFVTGGALSKFTFDPGQFSKSHPFSLPIVANFTRSGASISAPTGATPITLIDLAGLIGLSGHSAGSSGHPDFLAPSAVPSAVPSTKA